MFAVRDWMQCGNGVRSACSVSRRLRWAESPTHLIRKAPPTYGSTKIRSSADLTAAQKSSRLKEIEQQVRARMTALLKRKGGKCRVCHVTSSDPQMESLGKEYALLTGTGGRRYVLNVLEAAACAGAGFWFDRTSKTDQVVYFAGKPGSAIFQ